MVLRGVCMCGVWHGLRGTLGALSLSRWRKVGLPLALWQGQNLRDYQR